MIKSMRALKVAEDIVPVGEFKGQAARWLRHVAESGQPVVITQNGKPAGVLVSPSEYDRLTERQRSWSRSHSESPTRSRPNHEHQRASAATRRAAPARAVALKVIWTEQALVRLIEIQDFVAQSNLLRRSV